MWPLPIAPASPPSASSRARSRARCKHMTACTGRPLPEARDGRHAIRDDQLEAFGFEKPEKVPGEAFNVPHGNAPVAGEARRPAFALRHLLRARPAP